MDDRSSGDGSKRLDDDPHRFDDEEHFGHADNCECLQCDPPDDVKVLVAEVNELEQLMELQARIEHIRMRFEQVAVQLSEKTRDLEGTAKRTAELEAQKTVLVVALDVLVQRVQHYAPAMDRNGDLDDAREALKLVRGAA